MRVAVVGATGGSGQAVVHELVTRGHAVTALVRRPESAPPLGDAVRVATGDLTRAVDDHPQYVGAHQPGTEPRRHGTDGGRADQ